MKKLLRNLVLVLLPILVYYGVFIAFEPNNYFGLKEKADGTDIMAVLRAYQSEPGNRIILGDSRTANFDAELVQALTGSRYTNLSYGGAALKEQLDILDWAMQQNPQLEEVVFMASFYTLNKGYNHDRRVIAALNNPFAYMTNLGYNLNMLTNLYDHITPNRQVGGEGETMDPANYKYIPWLNPATGQTVQLRKTVAEHLNGVMPRSIGWQLNEELLERLLKAIETCQKAGIRFVVVLPPANEDIQTLVIDGLSIRPQMAAPLAALYASGALVLDYELQPAVTLREDQFYDGFHLDLERGLDAWTEMLFGAITAGEGAGVAA